MGGWGCSDTELLELIIYVSSNICITTSKCRQKNWIHLKSFKSAEDLNQLFGPDLELAELRHLQLIQEPFLSHAGRMSGEHL